MTMRVSFKVSKKGTRFLPKPKPENPNIIQDDDVDDPPVISKNSSVIVNTKPSEGENDAEILDTDISFFINLFPDGYSITNPSENRIQDDPKFLHPYDRTSESLFSAIELGLFPADFLDDIPCKFINGAVACEVQDYRNCGFVPGINGSSAADVSPISTKIRLKMSLENVVKDIPLISDSSWTYGDLMEVEARILIALQPKLDLDPTPNFDRLCKPPSSINLNLNIRELRRKRLRQMSGSENLVNGKKVCMENSNLVPDAVNLTNQNVGPTNMITSGPASTSLSYQSKYQIGQDMINSYGDNMNSNMGKRENQDGQLSPLASLTKRSQQQQSIGRGIQKYPFEGSFNQEQFTMGQPGMRYNLKQEPVESELNRNMLTQQFARSNFPPTPWNNLDNSRKEEQFQRRKTAQSPRVSSGALPQSPLSSKSGEFSGGSHGGQYGVPAPSQREKSAVTSVPTVGGANAGSMTCNAQMAARRSNSLPKTPAAMSGVGSPASVGNISGGPFNATSPLVGKETDRSILNRFSKIEMLTVRYQLNCRKNKVDEYKNPTVFPTQQLNHYLNNDQNNENPKDETCKMPLSKSLVGGSMNICKTRVLNFVQTERVVQGNGFSLVPKSRSRMILSEKRDDGTVAMHYGELDDCDYLAAEECLPTLPNTHIADLLAAQFCTLISREGYHVEGDHLQSKPTNTVRSSGDQANNNNASGVSSNNDLPETVSNQTVNENTKPSDSGTNNNQSVNARMHPPANSQPLQPSQPSFQQQNHHNLIQQIQRSSAMMMSSNPLSHLNAMGQNSNMQQIGHMLNKGTPLQQLQLLQQQQHPQMQRKMMMGLGNVGMGGNNGNNMVGLQGMGNVMGGMGGVRGISPGGISGMGQNSLNMNQASSISNAISQQLRSGLITPAEAALMTTKLRMAQNRNILGGSGGQSGNITGLQGANRQVLPGSSNYSMLGPTMNRTNNMNPMNTMNPMQRTAMAPPKLISGMNVYMNQQQQMPHQQQQMPHQQQQQESTSPLQAVLSPPQQQVGSPSMGLAQQQASPQQMSQRTPMSPQLSSGAIHPAMSAGNQDGANCPASPQLSSQTMGSVGSMTNSPMDMQGVNKSS